MLAGVGGGGPDGAPRPATATDRADPLAVTGIGGGGPFGPPDSAEAKAKKAPRQRLVPIDRIPVKEFLTRALTDGCAIRTTQHIVRKD